MKSDIEETHREEEPSLTALISRRRFIRAAYVLSVLAALPLGRRAELMAASPEELRLIFDSAMKSGSAEAALEQHGRRVQLDGAEVDALKSVTREEFHSLATLEKTADSVGLSARQRQALSEQVASGRMSRSGLDRIGSDLKLSESQLSTLARVSDTDMNNLKSMLAKFDRYGTSGLADFVTSVW